jgi:hypothetical protein
MMQDVHLGNSYVTGVGAQLNIGFTDSNGKPLAGASVTEKNSPAGLEKTTSYAETIRPSLSPFLSASFAVVGIRHGLWRFATSSPGKGYSIRDP